MTHAFSGVPNKGETIRSGCLTLAFSGAQKRAELLHNPYILGSCGTHISPRSEASATR